jgi:hypothetical protein
LIAEIHIDSQGHTKGRAVRLAGSTEEAAGVREQAEQETSRETVSQRCGRRVPSLRNPDMAPMPCLYYTIKIPICGALLEDLMLFMSMIIAPEWRYRYSSTLTLECGTCTDVV